MLTRLSIRNIVLIEALDLDFTRGLGVLTGETGASKSILLDALGLVLGNRAETALVRSGADQASVTATFEFSTIPTAIAQVLDDADIEREAGEPLLIRRRVKADGGSKAFVNDQPVGAALLRELSAALVELHGQHDDRGLVNPRGHRALLDRFADADTGRVAAAWSGWRAAEERLAEARAEVDQAKLDQDLLLAHLAELTTLEPQAGEEARLAQAMTMVLAQMEVERLLLEGGATAGTALARLQWRRLRVVDLAGADLPALCAADEAPRVFMKPGSYDWPESVWPK